MEFSQSVRIGFRLLVLEVKDYWAGNIGSTSMCVMLSFSVCCCHCVYSALTNSGLASALSELYYLAVGGLNMWSLWKTAW